MKKIIFILFCVLVVSCKNTQPKENPIIETAMDLAKKSPIKETKLFANFKIGMNEEQVDSVVKKLGEEDFLTLTEYIDEDSAPIESYYIFNSSYVLCVDDVHKMYLSFAPEYLNGKLSEMMYSIKVAKEDKNKYKEKPYEMLAHYFEKSERGRKFVKSSNLFKNNDSIFFYYKDNLIVSFQPNGQEGIMIYSNGPEQDELYKKPDQSKDF